MPEFRKAPVVDRRVIVSTERGQRPSDFPPPRGPQRLGSRPFCPAQEAMTPHELLAYRACQTAPNAPGWTVRVVPNKYPAVRREGALGGGVEGLFETRSGTGAHEVIIETPDHEVSLATLPMRHVEEAFRAFRDRLLDPHQDARLRAALIFKSHGAAAGADWHISIRNRSPCPSFPSIRTKSLEGARSTTASGDAACSAI